MHRRNFLLSASGAVAALGASDLSSPNDTVRVACVGVRGRGQGHVMAYCRLPNVEIAALCDVDESVLNQRLADAERITGKRPAAFTDFRKLLEDQSIDAVSIATPNHQHALQTIWACQAGKHVYVEKPCTHNMFECRQIAAAAGKYSRLVQDGSNSRSGVAVQEAVQQIRSGLIGDVYLARGLCFKWRDTIGRKPVEPVPPGVDYDLWLGPAPVGAFTRNRFHYNWHWFWEYGNGDLGNQGIHELDVARWGLGVTYPTKVTALGGHFLFDDDQETPNTMTALYEFDDRGRKKMMEFVVRHWISNHEAGIGEAPQGRGNPEAGIGEAPQGRGSSGTIGNVFYGSKGYLVVEGYSRYYSFLGREQQPGPALNKGGDNFANFIAALRSGKASDLNAPIDGGAVSCTLVHLANISYRLGRSINFDALSYTCPGDSEATRMFTRDYRAPFVVPMSV
ncbi:MAG: Gfo/Idh/MocA family oxidoreductase [Bryobacteraceae bacterium]|jgi:predicted dehydrogenase